MYIQISFTIFSEHLSIKQLFHTENKGKQQNKLFLIYGGESLIDCILINLVPGFPTDQRNGDKEFVIRRAATNRVLNVLRHWVSKHSQVRFTFTFCLFLLSICLHLKRKTILLL